MAARVRYADTINALPISFSWRNNPLGGGEGGGDYVMSRTRRERAARVRRADFPSGERSGAASRALLTLSGKRGKYRAGNFCIRPIGRCRFRQVSSSLFTARGERETTSSSRGRICGDPRSKISRSFYSPLFVLPLSFRRASDHSSDVESDPFSE